MHICIDVPLLNGLHNGREWHPCKMYCECLGPALRTVYAFRQGSKSGQGKQRAKKVLAGQGIDECRLVECARDERRAINCNVGHYWLQKEDLYIGFRDLYIHWDASEAGNMNWRAVLPQWGRPPRWCSHSAGAPDADHPVTEQPTLYYCSARRNSKSVMQNLACHRSCTEYTVKL